MRGVSKYVSWMGNLAKVMLAYRGTFVLMSAGSVIITLAYYYFWKAVYGSRPEIAGMDFPAMVTYVIVAQVVSGLAGFFFVEGSIASKIREGSIANELVVPMHYQLKQLCETLGFVGVRGAITGGIMFAVGYFCLDMRLPASWTAAMIFPVSVFLGIIIESSMGFCAAMTAFYTTNLFGVVMTRRMISDFFSGALVPLTFFPPALASVSNLLPFQATVFIPVSIYMGTMSPDEILRALAVQIFWAALAWTAGAFVWRRVIRRLEVQGG